ncbi:Tn3 family transposase [Streptomyces sp. NBC_00879]|uniref:Tn3 family transposase n=1 Tax=Streptomyces sp. NBC_00879 TaxID=2975855 RepID=UPI0038653454
MSLVVRKLSASPRQNALAAALKEYGAIRRTIYAAKYLSDEGYRRKIARRFPRHTGCSSPLSMPLGLSGEVRQSGR